MSFRAQARALLLAAARDGGTPTLLSPPAAAGFHGVGWWLALVAEWRRDFPDVAFEAVLDCGDSPGLALAALEAGAKAVRVEAAGPALAALQDIAAARGGRVIRVAPPPSGRRK